MRLRRLSVTGVTRFRREAVIDFSAIPPGVVAITGENGAGKTTLLESSGPASLFREFPTRKPRGLSDWLKFDGRMDLEFSVGPHECRIRHRYRKTQGPHSELTVDGISTDGKVGSFDERVERLLGSKQAFYASVFAMQTGEGRFASLGRADRRELFRFYLGLDEIAAAHEKVKGWAAGIDLAALQRAKDRAAEAIQELRELRSSAEKAEAAEAEARGELADLEAEIQRAAAWHQANGMLERLARIKRRMVGVPSADGLDIDDLRAGLAKAVDELARAEKIDRDLQAVMGQIRDASRRIELIDQVPCKAEGEFSGCPFLKEAVAAKTGFPKLLDSGERLSAAADGIDLNIITEERARCEKGVRDWELARGAARLAEEAKDTELDARKAWKAAKAHGDRVQTDPVILRSREAGLRRHLEACVRELERAKVRLSEREAEVARLRARIKKLRSVGEDYEALGLLLRALAPSGIPAMEIEAAGPVVGALANDLLAHCYGDRFTIQIVTQVPTKVSGGMKEVVDVVVQDRDRGREGLIETFSGGEQVIIDEAIRTAISLFGVEHGAWPFPMETMWRDETPAALYGENVSRYVMMLQRARTLGGFHHVLFVGSDEAARGADAVIRIVDGEFRVG